MFTDGWFLHGTDEAVSLHSQTSPAPVFYYYFTYRGSNSHSTIFGDATRNYGEKATRYIFPPAGVQNGDILGIELGSE
jgi:hypothetical protein